MSKLYIKNSEDIWISKKDNHFLFEHDGPNGDQLLKVPLGKSVSVLHVFKEDVVMTEIKTDTFHLQYGIYNNGNCVITVKVKDLHEFEVCFHKDDKITFNSIPKTVDDIQVLLVTTVKNGIK